MTAGEDDPRHKAERTPERCPHCGTAVAPALQAQHAEWHRRTDDATYGACPA